MEAEYLKNGEQIFKEYCSTADQNQPTMLPRAPEQTYIDRYPEEDQPAGPSFRDDRQHQSDYETEVKMYRAAELGLDGNFIVLHSFRYTHDQYCLCAGKSHVRNKKKCNKCKNPFNKEGECDFIIICPDSFIVIEVKNMEHVDRDQIVECEPDFHLCSIGEDWQPECTTNKLQALIGTYRKSAEQRSRVVELINFIDKNATILQFTAYPNFSKQFKEQFQFSEMTEFRLSDDELSTVIFEEDISHCHNKFDFPKKSSIDSATSLTEQTYPEQNYFSRLVSCFSRCCNKTTDTDDTNSEEEVISDSDNNPSNRDLVKTDGDLSTFNTWWAENVTQAISSIRRVSVSNTEIPITGYNQDSHEKARNILLAIWATDRNKCDQSKCSLGRCILDINKQLKEGQITFEPKKGKKRDKNPGVVDAPDVISKYVGVLNLTTQQNDVFNSSENMLWINGPAGAGKTVILCGKIIQLIQSDSDNKVVVFKFAGPGNNSLHYQHAFDKASIEYKLISTSKDKHTSAQLADLISSCSVIIVEIQITDSLPGMTLLIDILSVLSGYNLFVDDIQTVINYTTTAEMCTVLIDKLLELSADKTVWIACDIVQAWAVLDADVISIVANLLTDKLTANQRVILTMNLRNTSDLSNILSVIRDEFVTLSSLKSDILDLVLPTQLQGHFIHGPLPVIHVFNDFNVDSIIRVFNIELDSLCVTSNLNYSDIGIVAYVTSSVMSLVKDSVNIRCDNTGSKIAVCHSKDCASAHWPAVIVLHRVYGYRKENLTALYLSLSRARVYCSVIIYPHEGTTLDDSPYMLHLLDKLSNIARIIRY